MKVLGITIWRPELRSKDTADSVPPEHSSQVCRNHISPYLFIFPQKIILNLFLGGGGGGGILDKRSEGQNPNNFNSQANPWFLSLKEVSIDESFC